MLRLLASGAVIGGLWIAYAGPHEAAVETASDVTEPQKQVLEWRVSSRDGAQDCTIRLEKGGEASTYRMATGPGCRELVESLSQARVWRENERGTVTIEDGAGVTLAEFGPAEFDGMVSVYPRHMDLALLPAD